MSALLHARGFGVQASHGGAVGRDGVTVPSIRGILLADVLRAFMGCNGAPPRLHNYWLVAHSQITGALLLMYMFPLKFAECCAPCRVSFIKRCVVGMQEPICYFFGQGGSIMMYLYFLLTYETFEYHPIRQRLHQRWQVWAWACACVCACVRACFVRSFEDILGATWPWLTALFWPVSGCWLATREL
jgi:hypothetical protein